MWWGSQAFVNNLKFRRLAILCVILLLMVSSLPTSALQIDKAQAAPRPAPGHVTVSSCDDVEEYVPSLTYENLHGPKIVECHQDISSAGSVWGLPVVAAIVEFEAKDYYLSTGQTLAQGAGNGGNYTPCTNPSCPGVSDSSPGYKVNDLYAKWERVAGIGDTVNGYFTNFVVALNCANSDYREDPTTTCGSYGLHKDDGTTIEVSATSSYRNTNTSFYKWVKSGFARILDGTQANQTIQALFLFQRPENQLPDLVPNGTPQATVIKNDGTKSGPFSRGIQLDASSDKVEISNISVKNIGPTSTPNWTNIDVTLYGENISGTGVVSACGSSTFQVASEVVPVLAANAVANISNATISLAKNSGFNYFLTMSRQLCTAPGFALVIDIDTRSYIKESKENNNNLTVIDFMFPAPVMLPDLVPTFDGATLVTKYSDGHTATTPLDKVGQANFGTDVASFQLVNVGIKNIGLIDMDTEVEVRPEISLTKSINSYIFMPSAKIKLKVGETHLYTSDVFKTGSFEFKNLQKRLLNLAISQKTYHSPLTAKVEFQLGEYFNQATPANDSTQSKGEVAYIALDVKVVSGSGTVVDGALVRVINRDKSGTAASITNKNGSAFFAPLESMEKVGQRVVGISVYLGGQLVATAPDQTFTKNEFRVVTVSVSGMIVVRPILQLDYTINDSGTASTPPSGGTISIVSTTNGSSSSGSGKMIAGFPTEGKPYLSPLSAPVVDGVAVFSTKKYPSLIKGQYKLMPSSSYYNYPSGSGKEVTKVDYNWPEKTRSTEPTQSVTPTFNYDPAKGAYGTVTMLLKKTCQTDSAIKIEFCWYDDEANTTTSKNTIFPLITKQITRYQQFPDFPMTNSLTKVVFAAGSPKDGYAAFTSLEDGKPVYMVFNSVYSNYSYVATPKNTQSTIDHEMFHVLDFQYKGSGGDSWDFLTDKTPNYISSVKNQFFPSGTGATNTGQGLWNISSHNCAYFSQSNLCYQGYDSLSFFMSRSRIPTEAFAEEFSTVCTYGPAVNQRLSDAGIVAAWKAKYPGEAVPADLVTISREVLNRLQGKDASGNPYSQQLAGWYKDCMNSSIAP